MNKRDHKRDLYILTERQKGKTLSEIARALNISPERVRQIYVRTCADQRRPRFLQDQT